MAGRGPAPKGKRTRDRDTPEFREVKADGKLHGKPLPRGVLPKGQEDWHPQTLALWDSLRRSPLLADEPDLGWQFLVDTALMHHIMWTTGRWENASEIRLRLAKFGATPEDRMRLKVSVMKPAPAAGGAPRAATAGKVTDIRSRQARLTEQ
jgi:hypothetical protein